MRTTACRVVVWRRHELYLNKVLGGSLLFNSLSLNAAAASSFFYTISKCLQNDSNLIGDKNLIHIFQAITLIFYSF